MVNLALLLAKTHCQLVVQTKPFVHQFFIVNLRRVEVVAHSQIGAQSYQTVKTSLVSILILRNGQLVIGLKTSFLKVTAKKLDVIAYFLQALSCLHTHHLRVVNHREVAIHFFRKLHECLGQIVYEVLIE